MQGIPRVILLIETSHEFGRELIRGITRYSRIYGPWVFSREPRGLRGRSPKLHKWEADGIIIRGDAVKPGEVRAAGLPAIFAPRATGVVPGFPCILIDSPAVGRMGAEHLLERGFKNFGFCGFSDTPWSRKRASGFTRRVKQAGFTTHLYEKPESLSTERWFKEQSLIAAWLKSLPKPVGIMACTDYRGQHVLEGCKLTGIHVPEEVAVLGVLNDDVICELCDPPLSSVALDVEKGGYEAAALLDRIMAGKKVRPGARDVIIRPTHVVTRQSTDILATEDHEVAQAMRYIHEHARERIQVADVAAAAGLSRRTLEQRFRKVPGRSVFNEIQRVRIGQVCLLLTETNLSVAQIASALRFSNEKHISRPFRREKGMSPLAYRQMHSISGARSQ
jgi:LacI family transcriptional regulator